MSKSNQRPITWNHVLDKKPSQDQEGTPLVLECYNGDVLVGMYKDGDFYQEDGSEVDNWVIMWALTDGAY